jgi:VanZ family protein
MLVFRAFRAESRTRWRLIWAIYAMLVIVSWALLDEFHQTLTTRRGGSLNDSLIDSSGGFFGLVLVSVLSRLRRTRAASD